MDVLKQRLADFEVTWHVLLDGACAPEQWCATLGDRRRLVAMMVRLRDEGDLRFNQLIDVTGVDYLYFADARQRFAVVYSLLSHTYNRRVWVKVFVDEPDLTVPSVCAVWPGAEWPEREVYDMFGITFTGHPDLRRILTPEGFDHFPLRKDYPLRGLGERDQLPVITREDA